MAKKIQLQDKYGNDKYPITTVDCVVDSNGNILSDVLKNTYIMPLGGIPKSDLAMDVQTSLEKADTALQKHQSLAGYATETWVNQQGFLKSASLNGYATKDEIKDFVTKGTTLAHYGITDAVIYQNGIDAATDFKKCGYGHATGGWRGSGPAMIFGVQNYNLALQSSNGPTDHVALFVRNKYNGVEYGWDRIVTEGALQQGIISFDTSAYKCRGDVVLHRNADDGTTFLNSGPADSDKASLNAFGRNIIFYAGEVSAFDAYLILDGDLGNAQVNKPLHLSQTLDVAGAVRISTSITLKDKTITSWDDIKASGSVQWSDITGAPSYYESKGLLVVNALEVGTYIKATSYITTSGYIYAASYIKTSASGYVSTAEVITTRIYLDNDNVGITSWGDLKTILGLKALAYKDSIAFSEITSKPTTLSGYGITDAYTRAQVDALIANVEGGSGSGTGNITIDSALSETSVNPVQNNVITANINSINASLTSVNTTLGSLKSLAYKNKVNWDTDIENIPDDLGGEIKVVSQTATSGTVGINPNVLNRWSTALTVDANIVINFSESDTEHYMLEFTTGATVPTISLPSGVVWQDGYDITQALTVNRTYQISILNNLAVGGVFK